MSGLQNFLAPFSHLLFANRNLDIVVLCFVLFAVAVYALQNYWRASSLERELANRGPNPAAPAGRRYASAPVVEESAPEAGGLPPIKGGRSYARNLGTALQKAGISGPQIYSPPTPTGFSPNTNPMQPAMGQAPAGQPYGSPPTPWSPPAPPAPAPWGFPAGAGRNPGSGPTAAPFYLPQPGGPPAQPSPNLPSQSMPGFGAPAGYPQAQPHPAPQPSGPFASPFQVPTSGPGAPSAPPAFAAPGSGPMAPPPGGPGPMMPGLSLPGMGQPGPQPEAADASRRGKPKRRRFNFNVLENIEKIVQSRPTEPATTTAWTPPAQAAPPAASVVNPSAAGTGLVGPPAPPVAQPVGPAQGDDAAPTLPFLFGARSEPVGTKAGEPETDQPTTAEAPVEDAPAEPFETADSVERDTTAEEQESSSAGEGVEAPPLPVESSTVPENQTESEAESKPSMRSMMFGEEITAGSDAGVDAEPQSEPPSADASEVVTGEAAEGAAEPPAESEAAWPSYPWSRRGEETSSEDAVETPASQEPAGAVSDSDSNEVEAELATADEPASADSDAVPVEATAEAGGEYPSVPSTAADSEKPSAGTLVIIEDDQTAASYYATLFKGNGYQVEVANDGVSGVDLCARVQPQVILLDVMMPRQNGILVLQTLRASDETKNTPVVVMSNFSEPTLIKRALQLGALEYVIKTQVEGPALLNALPRWMNREKAFAAA